MDYWKECILGAFEDAKIIASLEQMNTVVEWVEGAHENYGMALGYDVIPNPLSLEIDKLKRALAKEQSKVICTKCQGRGQITTNGPVHSATSSCFSCQGEGRVLQ